MFIKRWSLLGWPSGFMLGACLVASGMPLQAVERSLRVEAPPEVAANEAFSVIVSAGTDAGQGEHVGFLQVEVSLDRGRTWTPMRYLDNLGPRTRQVVDLKAGEEGSVVEVRARVAFRDGLAGNVDYTGAAIRWHANWDRWENPPAKTVVIRIGE